MIEMIAFVDASPLIYLAQINALNFLPKIFDEVITSQVVKDEVLALPSLPDQIIISQSFEKWLKIAEPKNLSIIDKISRLNLHAGEASIITLALEYKKRDGVIIIDDRAARDVALALNLKITGTLGVLIRLVRAELITIDVCLNMIRKLNLETTFRISIELMYEIQDYLRSLDKS